MIRVLHCLLVVLLVSHVFCDAARSAQDDKSGSLNRIIRVKPSPTAAKIGQGVAWEKSWDDALAKSKATGKSIFWYVPTIPGTFMDRKTEIDRYMLAGPFSWPATIQRLNQDFIPLNVKPSKDLADRFELKPYKFVEPGFLIVDPDQSVRLRVDHLTTLHPFWFERLVASAGPANSTANNAADPERVALNKAWDEFAAGNFPDRVVLPQADDPFSAEKLLLAGMIVFRRGDQQKAKELWTQAAATQPDSPMAWKAAAEAEGFGPFVRGFEVFSALPEKAFRAGIDSRGSAAPSETYTEPELWQRSVEFLLGMQATSGGIFDSDYDFGGFDSLPNVHTAVTSLVGMALLESLKHVEPQRHDSINSAISRAAEFVSDEKNINLQDKDEILWAQAYRVRFLASLVQAKFGDTAKYQTVLNRMVKGLEEIQLKNGGWYHEYANPFVTGTALTALHHAQQAGAVVDTQKVERGLASLANDRFENGAYPYSSRDGKATAGKSSVEASAGRVAICDMALWMWQKLDDEQLEKSARVSLDNHKYLNVAYKYDNHTSTMAYGGFFFWYDMQARSEMIARIKNAASRKALAEQHRQLILDLPEIDGCFVDSHELGRCYGTAMALLSLAELQ